MITESLTGLAQAIRHCTKCERSETREQAVPGEGVEHPALLLVGEAPGKKENESGRPFVGRYIPA